MLLFYIELTIDERIRLCPQAIPTAILVRGGPLSERKCYMELHYCILCLGHYDRNSTKGNLFSWKIPFSAHSCHCFGGLSLNTCTLKWQLSHLSYRSTAFAQSASDSIAHVQFFSPVDEKVPFQPLFKNIGENLAFPIHVDYLFCQLFANVPGIDLRNIDS
jgi:hypothetical protein